MKKTNVTKATANTASKVAKTPKAASKPKAENSVKKTEAPQEEPKKESKITKADMIEMLEKCLTITGLSKNLKEQIEYTLAHKAKATMNDLRELVSDAGKEAKALHEAQEANKSKAENSVKKPLKKSGKKADEPKEEAPKTLSKSTKKPAKEEAPKEAPKKKSLKAIDMLVEFPETVTITDGDDEIELEKVDVKKYEDVVNMLEEDEDVEIYIAVYWNKRQIQQFNYSKGGYFKVPNGKFENDLDMVNLIYPGTLTAVGISAYTEAPYIFIPESFKPDTDGMKYTEGAEFEVYKVIK